MIGTIKEIKRIKSEAHDYRTFLQMELLDRCRSNPRYSLRAFARVLKVSPSALSAMLNGKRRITFQMKKRFSSNLGMDPANLFQLEKRELETRLQPELHSKKQEFQQIAADTYTIISEWYHYAILELLKVESFSADPAWIAKSLGITRSEANFAIERLQRIGLLKLDHEGKWLDTSSDGNATNIIGDLSTGASRKLQRQILEMSARALEEIPNGLRDHTSMTLAIDPKDISVAKEKIKTFRRELTHYLERTKKPKQVYHLNISLYPVTQLK